MAGFDLDDLLADNDDAADQMTYWPCSRCKTENPSDVDDCLGCGRFRYEPIATDSTSREADARTEAVVGTIRIAMLAFGAIGVLAAIGGVWYAGQIFKLTEYQATVAGHHYDHNATVYDASGEELRTVNATGSGIPRSTPKAKAGPGETVLCSGEYAVVLDIVTEDGAEQKMYYPLGYFGTTPQDCKMLLRLVGELGLFSKGQRLTATVNGHGGVAMVIPEM